MTMSERSLAAWCAALTIGVLSACGGGGQSGGGADGLAGIGSGGTGSFSDGPVTGFGSIIVNGIHFDQSKAEVTGANDRRLTPADIKLGMVVALDGSSVSKTGGREAAEALHIRIKSALLGQVEAKTADSLTIMGQTVMVSKDEARTRFGDELPGRLDSVSVGDTVEVYGFHDAGQDLFVATRIERKGGMPPASYQVRGVIQDLDLVNGRCRIGKQMIYYTKWTSEPGMANPANGKVAVATVGTRPGSQALPDGSVQQVWTAQVMVVDQPVSPDQGHASLDGLVSSLEAGAPGRFAVNGVSVDASKIGCGICAGLRVGEHVKVRGSLVKDGVTATSVTRADPF